MFKKRVAPKNTRKADEKEEGKDVVDLDNVDDDGTADRLREMRETQKEQWGRHRGVLPTPTVKKTAEEEEEAQEEEHWGLDSGFTSNKPQEKSDPHLEAFLNERLYKKNDKEDKVKEKTREEKLYEIPEGLQVPDSAAKSADKMSWMAGLAEVPLGVEYKLANIEATEKAKREFLLGEGKQSKGPVLEPDAITRKAFGSRFMNVSDGSNSRGSSDDAALERFRKRFRK